MARLSLLAFFALAFFSVALAAPGLGDLQVRGTHGYSTCASTWALASQCQTGGTQQYRHAGGSNEIISVSISPDPPKAGEYFSVTVKASTPEELKVSVPNDCGKWCRLTTGFRRIHSSSSLSIRGGSSCGLGLSKFASCTPVTLTPWCLTSLH